MFTGGELIEGKYKVVRLIGEGGMGAVYEGENLRLRRRVAIKVMHGELTTDRDLVSRFEREAQAAAKVDSAHIVDVLDLGDLPNGDRFMVMEFLEGESLLARLQEHGRLPPREVASIAVQLLSGLTHVHRAGIFHRDLKPANVFLTRDVEGSELVKILDFGACKMATARVRGEQTAIGHLLGTLPYMAPETVEQGSTIYDERSDLYSVGVLVYRSVTGQLPYMANNLYDLMKQLRAGRAPHTCDVAPDVDRALGAIIDRAIEWDPKARFQDARAFERALTGWMEVEGRIKSLLTDFLDVPSSSDGRVKSTAPASTLPASMLPASTAPTTVPDGATQRVTSASQQPHIAVSAGDNQGTKRYGAETDGPLLDYLSTQSPVRVSTPADTERSMPVAQPVDPDPTHHD